MAQQRRLQVLSAHVLGHSPVAAHPSAVRVSPEVRDALAAGRPVVALESTIISHGMPFPQNLETARAVERDVREAGAVPATVAVLDGVPCVGLDDQQLERLAREGTAAKKTSRRDLPYVVAQRLTGATTVSATMYLAAAAGVTLFVTGGIGGVHRGASDTWDVSADLTELARTRVTVICAGAKSILDIRKTLEVLETAGVPVCVLGSSQFPAFYTASSGVRAPWRLDSPAEVAAAMHAADEKLLLNCGMLVAVPIPQEHAADGAAVEAATTAALAEADRLHLSGAEVTPFLLKRVAELTSGASLRANIALVRNNARVGARIAVEHARLSKNV